MISAALQKAIDSLRIHDVYLRDLAAHCVGDFDPKYNADLETLVVQTRHHVKQSIHHPTGSHFPEASSVVHFHELCNS